MLTCPFLSKFAWKTPAVMPIFGQLKRHFCNNYTILWVKKVNMMEFFPIFHNKINALMPILYQKYIYSPKKHSALKLIFCQKNLHSLKNTVLSFHFCFQTFSWKKPLLSSPYLVKKRPFSRNYYYMLGPKSQYNANLFQFSRGKYLLSCPYFFVK